MFSGEDLEVQVVDFNLDVLAGLSMPGEVDFPSSAQSFTFAEDPNVFPDVMSLLGYAREWLVVSNASKAQFYSAAEDLDAEPKAPVSTPKAAKAKAPRAKAGEKAKKSAPQLVAEQIQGLSTLLPSIAQTLAEVQQEQTRPKEIVEGSALNPPTRASQAQVSMSMNGSSGPTSEKEPAFVGRPSFFPRASGGSRGSTRGIWRQFGFSGSGAKQGPDVIGVPPTIRRRPASGSSPVFKLKFNVLERCTGARKVAKRIGVKKRRFLPVSSSECLQETTSGFKGARLPRVHCRHGLLHADISRLFWRLRRGKGCWPDAVCPQLHHGCSSTWRPGWSQRTCCSHGSRPGTRGARPGEMGTWVPVDAFGRNAGTDLEPPKFQLVTNRQDKGFRATLPPALGHRRFGDYISARRADLNKPTQPPPAAQPPQPKKKGNGKGKGEAAEPRHRCPGSLTRFFFLRASLVGCFFPGGVKGYLKRCLMNNGLVSSQRRKMLKLFHHAVSHALQSVTPIRSSLTFRLPVRRT